ncbi:MAG: tetratricopeptide repeat protein [Chloroflexi bacterium]|nr:tetratricopeptide repeat protein [Chloroflexota bacterium]
MLRVFISSTSNDLRAHRDAVRDAVLSLGMHPIMMEHFPSMDADAIAACKAEVQSCDIFVGIYAHRYGYIPDGHTISISEMEYNWAKEIDLPTHLFVIDEVYPWDEAHYDEYQTQLRDFKQRMGKGHVWATFTSPDSLAARVTQSLSHDRNRLTRQEQRQRRALITGFGLLLVLILAVVAFIIASDPDEEQIGISQADRQATNQALANINATATATLWTPVPPPSPTPLEGEPAVGDEIVVVVARFEQPGTIASQPDLNIAEVLAEAAADYPNVRIIRIGHAIETDDRATAARVLDLYGATMVVYGRVEGGGAVTRYEIVPRTGYIEEVFDGLVRVSAVDVTDFAEFLFSGQDSAYILNFTLGQLAYFNEDYQAALRSFQQALDNLAAGREADLNAGLLNFYMGYANWQMGTIEIALDFYDRAITLNEENAVFFNNRGHVLSELERYDEAIADYDRAIGLDPNVALPYVNRGNAYWDIGEYELAVADYSRALEIDPLDPFTWSNRAVLYLSVLDEIELAIADYDAAIALNPTDPYPFFGRGTALVIQEEYDAALADFDRALELDPTMAVAYYARGLVNLSAGNNSLEDFQNFVDTLEAPGDIYERCALGVANTQLENYEIAVEHLQICVDEYPGNTNPYELMLALASQAIGLTPVPSATADIASNPAFEPGTAVVIEGVRPLLTFDAPGSVRNAAICLPGTEATVLQTVSLRGQHWVEIDCDGGTGWVAEVDLKE